MKNDNVREFFILRDSFRQKSNGVDLSVGIPCHLPPAAIYMALKNTQIICGYSDPTGSIMLRKLLAISLNNDGYSVDHNNLMITASGASGGLNLALQTAFRSSDEILLPDPYFPSYIARIKSLSLIPVPVSTYESDFRLDIKKFEKVITNKTRGLIINSPNNPTGKLYSEKEISDISNFAKQYKLTLISDEIYSDFVYDGVFLSPYKYYPQGTIVIRSFSKNLALLDFRLGYSVGSTEVIKKMTELQFQISVCPSSFLQQIIAEAYDENFTDYIKKTIGDYKRKKDFVVKNLTGVLEFDSPQGAFYLFANVPKKIGSGYQFAKLLAKEGLLVMPGGLFSGKDSHIRISFSDTNDNLKKGINTLKNIVV